MLSNGSVTFYFTNKIGLVRLSHCDIEIQSRQTPHGTAIKMRVKVKTTEG